MIARFLFEFVPSSVTDNDLIHSIVYFGISIIFGLSALFAFVNILLFLIKKFEISNDVEEISVAATIILSILLIAGSPLLPMTSYIDFLNAQYMGGYANGNYKYSKIMKYCITQDKANYEDEEGDQIKHDTVRGIMLCYQWERYAFIKQEKKAKEAAKVEQIKKEVR